MVFLHLIGFRSATKMGELYLNIESWINLEKTILTVDSCVQTVEYIRYATVAMLSSVYRRARG